MFGNPTTAVEWGGGVMQLSMTAAVPRTRDYIMLENEEIVIPAILTMAHILTHLQVEATSELRTPSKC